MNNKLKQPIIIALLFLMGFVLNAQDDKIENLTFEETPVINESPVYFSIGLGYLGNFFFANYTDVNTKIKSSFTGLPELSGPVYMQGAHGFVSIGIIKNLRFGFFGYGGTKSVTMTSGTNTMGVNYGVGITGASIDYGIVMFKSFAVLPGINIGAASVDIDFYNTSSTIDWNNINNVPETSGYLKRMEGKFYYIQPNISLEYALSPFLMFKAGAGYSLSFSPSWKYNTNATLDNVPSSINASGLNAFIGLSLGIFNF